jgi:hypothetical protein
MRSRLTAWGKSSGVRGTGIKVRIICTGRNIWLETPHFDCLYEV